MSKFKDKFRIESARLREWDYSNPWLYFVTINSKEQFPFFGKINNGNVILNDLGVTVEKFWSEIPVHFENTVLDYYIVMPNHFHGIINIIDSVKTPFMASLLGNIIGKFKGAVTRWAHDNNYPNFQWQSRYYDRVIRDEKELYQIRNYIEMNPAKLISE